MNRSQSFINNFHNLDVFPLTNPNSDNFLNDDGSYFDFDLDHEINQLNIILRKIDTTKGKSFIRQFDHYVEYNGKKVLTERDKSFISALYFIHGWFITFESEPQNVCRTDDGNLIGTTKIIITIVK